MDKIKPTDAQIFVTCITAALHGEDDKAFECMRLYNKARAAGRKEALREVETAWIESGVDATTDTLMGKQVDAGLRCSVFWKWLYSQRFPNSAQQDKEGEGV